jgi:hypothetical protein
MITSDKMLSRAIKNCSDLNSLAYLICIMLIFLSVKPLLANTSDVEITLVKGDKNTIINTAELSIRWQPVASASTTTTSTSGNSITANTGNLLINGKKQKSVNIIQQSKNQAKWSLYPSNINVKAVLTDTLTLSFDASDLPQITRNKPIMLQWFDLAHVATTELLLPFSEGMRIPTNNTSWIDYLENTHTGANTTHNLKMPFWSFKQNNQFVTAMLMTPTNNQLQFKGQNNKLDMLAKHLFTPLNQSQAFVVELSVNDHILDGAKRYRQWRIQQGFAEPLTVKIKRNKSIKRLIGAAQIYLFGTSSISVQDVKDWWGFKDWYFNKSNLHISVQAREQLHSLSKGNDWLSNYHKQLLVDSLHTSLIDKFPSSSVSLSDNSIASQFTNIQKRKKWLIEHANDFLVNNEKWGQALSADMLSSFKQSGLTKLWLGMDNWKPAFFQPELVDKAIEMGFLVATYDSYNTAIALGVNDTWLTAQLPNEMRQQCAIENADGSKKKGFRNNGYYLNPSCHLPYVQERIQDIVKYGRFNSIFLDVDGTAMAREDYNTKDNESQMLDAFNARMNWIATHTNTLLATEDGNSLTTQGVALAHGLETIGFGWTDQEMKRNKKSPYYLGRWYPNHKPDFFFKPAKVKEPYKTLLFSPQYRLPLYQTVFHDEIINSHHWHSDSLKFSNVKTKRDLISMLYVTPAMVHLSRDEASSKDSGRIKAIAHYQQAYRPIHTHLWDKQLIDFIWLDEQGSIQQTRFSDGSTITANFSDKAFRLNKDTISAFSILAQLSDGETINWTSKQ